MTQGRSGDEERRSDSQGRANRAPHPRMRTGNASGTGARRPSVRAAGGAGNGARRPARADRLARPMGRSGAPAARSADRPGTRLAQRKSDRPGQIGQRPARSRAQARPSRASRPRTRARSSFAPSAPAGGGSRHRPSGVRHRPVRAGGGSGGRWRRRHARGRANRRRCRVG